MNVNEHEYKNKFFDNGSTNKNKKASAGTEKI